MELCKTKSGDNEHMCGYTLSEKNMKGLDCDQGVLSYTWPCQPKNRKGVRWSKFRQIGHIVLFHENNANNNVKSISNTHYR